MAIKTFKFKKAKDLLNKRFRLIGDGIIKIIKVIGIDKTGAFVTIERGTGKKKYKETMFLDNVIKS